MERGVAVAGARGNCNLYCVFFFFFFEGGNKIKVLSNNAAYDTSTKKLPSRDRQNDRALCR